MQLYPGEAEEGGSDLEERAKRKRRNVGWALSDFAVVLCTAPPGGAENIARTIVQERLAACVNVTEVKSYFAWEGKLCMDPEELMIIKTNMKTVEPLRARIKELHSYELPEIIVLPIVAGDEGYLQWIKQSVG
jgi:periplasmic divalent cation tolerance protein